MVETLNTNRNGLSALDPSLSYLASEAAFELDNILIGEISNEPVAVKLLAQRLQNSTEAIGAGDTRQSLMDPTTISVFSNAIAASGLARVSTLEDLAAKAWKISQDLEHSSKEVQTERQSIERLRNFCVFLADSAVAQERLSRDLHFQKRNWS
jgi:hypothetical protein